MVTYISAAVEQPYKKGVSTLLSNQQLFSEAYLRELRLQKPVSSGDAIRSAQQTIREWRSEYPNLEGNDERTAYVGVSLSALGLSYGPHADGYVLYADEIQAEPLGLCLIVADENLANTMKGQHHQGKLIRELRRASLKWGIVTNGKQWRLCNAEAPAPYEVYLDANVDELLHQPEIGDFALFYKFFGRNAFVRSTERSNGTQQSGLDRYLAESEQRTEAIQRYLRSKVEPVLQSLCLGFVQDAWADTYTRAVLKEIYDNSIYLLYRMLFLFYAEARGLMPLADPRYQKISLASILEDARKRQQEGVENSDRHSLWKRLARLCEVVDKGLLDEDNGSMLVDPYNGGLFSDEKKPYLKTHKILDIHLARALFELGYMQTKGSAHPIDYRDLSVRILGTLYEGLLEYNLNVVENEPIVVRQTGGKEMYIPQSQAGYIRRTETILEEGKVYFADDKGERKSSGSYYTPEDIVQYMVANSVVPKVEERCMAIGTRIEAAHVARLIAVNDEERLRTERYYDEEVQRAIKSDLLSLRILDPTMGSAHFLVAAGQVVANSIVEVLNRTDWCAPRIDADPIIWKRRVVECCLYGVDCNPLAQELAKLSLWLSSIRAGKPLTFFEHHLKKGNSLYGAPLTRLAMLPTAKKRPPNDMFQTHCKQTLRVVLDRMEVISNMDSDHIDNVNAKGEINEEIRKLTQPLRDLANVWLATLFDLEIDENEYTILLQDVAYNYAPEAWEPHVEKSDTLRAARKIAELKDFFHWELEFPEAVEGSTCQFDVIIGNPPYVGRTPDKAISILYESAKAGDLYSWIFERSLKYLNSAGKLAMIVPLSITFSRQLCGLRRIILESSADTYISSFDASRDGIFPPNGRSRNHQRASIILHHRRGGDGRVYATNLLRWLAEEREFLIPSLKYAEITEFAGETRFHKLGDDRLIEFWKKMVCYGRTIEDFALNQKKDYVENVSGHPLFLASTAGYFITAMPQVIRGTGVNKYLWADEWTRDLAFLALNSNVFYWVWCMLGDGFHVTGEVVNMMALPNVPISDPQTVQLRDKLLGAANQCVSYHLKWGKRIPNYNFNKRMGILLDIDEWLVGHIAPNLKLPRDIFAQYKSNSYLKPMNIAELSASQDDVIDEVAE
ncbi:MAG TPA: Eco57I restriction-modification methylase domain-containing protein [Chloroflexia bacterium]|jgi:hypothetical protein